MRYRSLTLAVLAGVLGLTPAAGAAVLSADSAVVLALKNSTQAIQADASVLDARAGYFSASSGVLPSISASGSRSVSTSDNGRSTGGSFVGTTEVPPTVVTDDERYSNNLGLSGRWNILNLSSIKGYSAARTNLQAAELFRISARQDIIFFTRRQFYEVVRAVRLSAVANGSLHLARDDERRVRALFEVGSVSKSDLLRAQVRTSSAQLDSLIRRHAVTVQRNLLARQLGISEGSMGEVDTVLAVQIREFSEDSLLVEARNNRPDVKALEAELRAAKASHTAAKFARLPYLTLAGSMGFDPRSHTKTTVVSGAVDSAGFPITVPPNSFRSEADRTMTGTIAIQWDLFDGRATDARIASARSRLIQAQDAWDVLDRSLAQDVHEAWITYSEALEAASLATRSVESATENLNLTQQKYNVGSATILDLVDAQVQLLQAQSDQVSAQAGIRVAEAGVERIRGTGR